MAIALTLAFAAIGFADDWLKIRRGRSLGLKAREKLALQTVGALAFYLILLWLVRHEMAALRDIPRWTLFARFAVSGVIWTLLVLATSNAVNLADGLDGLAAGLCAVAFIGVAVIGWAKHTEPAVTLALSMAGACLGFLWFNRHPARVFMGDVGSLALGAALASLSLYVGLWALIGLCFVPFLEAASVMIQVISFKTTGKRVFRMSPIHHHFELSGWPEQRVVYTFWAVGAAAAAVTVWMQLR
jgi:phospho-N-acetylmuramoyl-pentapeptide-transferase